MRTLMHTHDHQYDVCLNLSIVRALFPWYQLLLVESNWIGCNWLWSAGWNSKCWLCINIQIKSLFILCVYVCTDVCCCIDCKRRPWADITCVAKKIKKMTERKSGDFYGEKEEWRLGNKEVGDRVMRSVVKGRKGDAAPTLKAREDENWKLTTKMYRCWLRLPPDLMCVFACVTRCLCCFTSAVTENRLLLFLEHVRPRRSPLVHSSKPN